MIEPIKLHRIEEARHARLVKIEGDETKQMQIVYRLELNLPNTCLCKDERSCHHPRWSWGDAGQVWDCSRYHRPSVEPVFTSPNTDDQPQFYRTLADLKEALIAAGVSKPVYMSDETVPVAVDRDRGYF